MKPSLKSSKLKFSTHTLSQLKSNTLHREEIVWICYDIPLVFKLFFLCPEKIALRFKHLKLFKKNTYENFNAKVKESTQYWLCHEAWQVYISVNACQAWRWGNMTLNKRFKCVSQKTRSGSFQCLKIKIEIWKKLNKVWLLFNIQYLRNRNKHSIQHYTLKSNQ